MATVSSLLLPCTKLNVLLWKNLTAFAQSPDFTFGMNMNGNCEPTSVADLTNAPVDERQQIPAARFVNLEQSLKPDERRLEWQTNALVLE